MSRAAIDFPSQAYRAFRDHVDGDPSSRPPASPQLEDLLAVMAANLFLQDDDFDELEYIREQSRRSRFSSSQLGLVIAPTMSCNFACHYCFEAHADSALDTRLEDQLASLVTKRIDGYDELAVQWFGGEPLQDAAQLERVSARLRGVCRDHDKGYAATVITNGYLMEATVSAMLVEQGVHEVQITLDGDRDLHDRTRTQADHAGSFDRIMANIVAAPSALAINLRVHLAPFNRHSVLDLIDRLGRDDVGQRIKYLYFAPLFDYHVDRGPGQYRVDGKRFASSAAFAALEVEALRRAGDWGIPVKDFLDVSYGICTAVRENTLVVDSRGQLTKCYKDIGVPAEAVGTLLHGITRAPAVDEWLDVKIPRDQECADCTFLPVCLGGCTKQWREGADKSVICTPLKFNYDDRVRLYFRDPKPSTVEEPQGHLEQSSVAGLPSGRP